MSRNANFRRKESGVRMEGGVALMEADVPYLSLGRNTHSAEGPHHIGKLR